MYSKDMNKCHLNNYNISIIQENVRRVHTGNANTH